jgi:hypothetical protein
MRVPSTQERNAVMLLRYYKQNTTGMYAVDVAHANAVQLSKRFVYSSIDGDGVLPTTAADG